MSNRINGDFDTESIEAFRAAYATQILEPEDQEVDSRTGLPTEVVLNTSPWIGNTGLWKANDGSDKNFLPNQVLVPGVSSEEESLYDGEGDDDVDEFLDSLLTEEEEEEEEEDLDDLIESLLEEEEEEEDLEDLDNLIESLLEEEEEEEDLDNLIESLLEEEEEEEDLDLDGLLESLSNELEDDPYNE